MEIYKQKIKLRIRSQICNLVFDEMERRKNDSKLLAERRRMAYEAWIDSIPQKYEFESTDRSLAEVEDPSDTERAFGLSDDGGNGDKPNGAKSKTSNIFGELKHEIDNSEFGEMQDIIEFTTCGELVKRAGRISVIYDESVILEKKCKTTLTFREENPNRISIFRTGDDNASLVFDSVDRRIMCMYNTLFGQISMVIITHGISNTAAAFEKNGRADIKMDYTIEVNGVKTEYTHYEMTIEPADNDDGDNTVPMLKL